MHHMTVTILNLENAQMGVHVPREPTRPLNINWINSLLATTKDIFDEYVT